MKIPKNSALLVIDLQDGEAEDGMNDGIPVMQGSHTYENAPKIIKFFREHNLPVVQIRECHRADTSFLLWFMERISTLRIDYTIPKLFIFLPLQSDLADDGLFLVVDMHLGHM